MSEQRALWATDEAGSGMPQERIGTDCGGLRECPECHRPFRPYKRAEGRQLYCSTTCRTRAWKRKNPQPVPPEGEPYEGARVWLLERLRRGPVCTLELRREPWPASQNPAQRVLELRNRQWDIRTVRRGGKAWYWLWEDGEPVGKVEG